MIQRGAIEQGDAATSRAGCLVRFAAVLAVAAGLAGCAAMSEKIADTASDMPAIGVPAGAPARPAEQLAYPAVHDLPPPRSAAVLNEVEQQKMEDDLVAAREAQRGAGKSTAARKKAARQKPPAVPVASSGTIY